MHAVPGMPGPGHSSLPGPFALRIALAAARGGGRGHWGGRGRGGPGAFAFGDPRGGFGFPPFRGGPFQQRQKVKRGDVRAAVLALLNEQPRNGYQLIQEISERSDGMWKPSPGSVYPALQQLEDEGLVQADRPEGRREFHLTEEGRAYVAEHPDEVTAPWESMREDMAEDVMELRHLFGQVGHAFMQVAHVGTDDQVAQARTVMTDARRSLYRILAEDDDDVVEDAE